jgi:ferredoxin
MVVYFSGTGNSRYAAQMLAGRLGDGLIDLGAMIKAGEKAVLHAERPWVFVSPAYAWQIPKIFADAILDGSFSGAKEAYFVMTCGSDIGNAGSKIAQLCRKKGFEYLGVLQVIMPENYIAMYDVPNRKDAQKIISAARPVLEGGIAAIQAKKPFHAGSISISDKIKTGIVNPVFYRFCVTAKPFYATDSCVSCGKCASACPLNNIGLLDGKPQWGEACTHCMACICLCPKDAIEYGQKSKGKPRYQCEEYNG